LLAYCLVTVATLGVLRLMQEAPHLPIGQALVLSALPSAPNVSQATGSALIRNKPANALVAAERIE